MAANPYQAIEAGEPGTIGWRIHYFDEVGSTQRIAAEMAEQEAAQGTVVIAEQQTAGRGRMGRSWHSPPGLNLYSTTILRPRIPVAEVPRLSLVAGVAAAEAIEATVGRGRVALKWPNDIWLAGRKAGGIIAEAVAESGGSGLACVLLGIGLNLNLDTDDLPPDLRDKATSVRIVTGRRCDRIAIAAALFNRLNTRYMETEADGFGAIRPIYDGYLALRGRAVTVVDGASRTTGTVRGIDQDGALILEADGAAIRIVAGDVTVEGAYA